ncbi:phospholipase D-like domain-containing protein [Halorubrum ezzemoulense]|uniref:helicase-related protein n=1 Tax=Halorubrum ezzemoulense TaxID=337243 RepID=UPI00232D02C3|nr:helicase-related protein [Halorubrum ezzemoulense]MDB2225745.1 phospholipase D-like domain-containing protein [Halorubrum ezzemoulense]
MTGDQGSVDDIDWSDYSDVLDNRNYDVADRANVLAREADTVKIAVGYFFLGGFDLLKENLRGVDSVEILVGTDTDQRTIEELERGFADDLDEYDKAEAEDGISRLYELIQDEKVRVRVYDDARFHPKLYLFRDPAGSPDLGHAIIGSSNLSPSGLRGNVELNVEKKDNATIRALEEWFDDIWAEASEFDTDLMTAAIERSQFGDDLPEIDDEDEPEVDTVETISPYEATKRFIVEQFSRDVREGTLLEDITGDYEEQLTAFQQDAFRAARRPLEKYNGVVLADSVGLGKSYIGAPLVQDATTSRDEVLIIAPNRLKPMWKRELLDAETGEFPTTAEKTFISFNKLSRLSEGEIQRFRGVDMVLVDEAHNLRNTGTQRYDKLQSIGRQGKKFVMLTATPIHNSVRDVDNLIKVFADDDDFDIELGGMSPSEIFKEYDRLSGDIDEGDGEDSADEAPTGDRRRLSELESKIESIMREVIISRDRKYILDNYDDITIGGRQISVPERQPRLITPDDPRLDELYSDIVDAVIGTDEFEDSGLNIPYVSADRYDADGDEKEELIIEYQNASILMLINLLKRLESSLAAFEDSVDRLMQRERITRHIATGDLEDADARHDAVEQIRDTFDEGFTRDIDFEDVADAITQVSSDKREEIVADIDEDLAVLERIREQARDALQTDEGGRTKDAKAERLRSLIDRELTDEKVILFSQYVPTVTHLFEQITGENPAHTQVATINEEPGGPTVGYIHGGSGYSERIVKRFAPEAQDADVGENEEIDILLATDVLGVGQNLQDARVLVNYDLHWNPMKMEQRIGRIDRITTRHDSLWIYNFAPTGDLRRQLGLVERIEEKIRDIANTFGHAAPILDSAEERVHKTLMTYERLEEGGDEFGDERLEGIGSKYDDLRNSVQSFCEENDLDIDELRETREVIDSRTEPQHFLTPGESDNYVTLTHLEHSSGRTEWRTTVFDSDRLQSTTIGGQAIFTQFPRLETDDVRVFETIASPDTTRYSIPESDLDELRNFANELGNPSTWEDNILSRQSGQSDVITDIIQLCRNLSESDEEISGEAAEIADLLDEQEISDWAENQLRTIHRRRRRYGTNGTIQRLHHKLTEEIELVDPEKVSDADVALAGQLSPEDKV